MVAWAMVESINPWQLKKGHLIYRVGDYNRLSCGKCRKFEPEPEFPVLITIWHYASPPACKTTRWICATLVNTLPDRQVFTQLAPITNPWKGFRVFGKSHLNFVPRMNNDSFPRERWMPSLLRCQLFYWNAKTKTIIATLLFPHIQIE